VLKNGTSVVYRALRDNEFHAAVELFYKAVTALADRSNMPMPHRDGDLVEQGFRYVARTGVFRVAATDDSLVALACATVRASQWFLVAFWTDPERRSSGIGGPLLRQVWDEGRRLGTRMHYVTSSIDFAAIASYLKMGMLPGMPLFAFAGEPTTRSVALRSAAHEQPLTAARVAPIDLQVIGVRRDGDHAYWLGQEGVRGVVVRASERDVGYYYVDHGTLGPIAWSGDEFAELVLRRAIRDAASDTKEIQLTIPGSNHAALRIALSAGLRLTRQSHLLWSEPIGEMARYIPAGRLLF
jgi:GNAT superfamily N-acetyltransferase